LVYDQPVIKKTYKLGERKEEPMPVPETSSWEWWDDEATPLVGFQVIKRAHSKVLHCGFKK
jgi:hypothetical protein